MDINPDLAVAILEKLLTFPYGIGEICANDFKIPCAIFVAQLEAMACKSQSKGRFYSPLISAVEEYCLKVATGITDNDTKVNIAITDAGKEYLTAHR
jgi:hypothetical protein